MNKTKKRRFIGLPVKCVCCDGLIYVDDDIDCPHCGMPHTTSFKDQKKIVIAQRKNKD